MSQSPTPPYSYQPPQRPPQPPPTRPPAGISTTVLAVFVLVLAIVVAWTNLWPIIRPIGPARVEITPRGELADFEETTITIFEQSSPSVVFITNEAMRFRGLHATTMVRGSGTGFIWDEYGHVVTNFHVVAGADKLVVTLADQTSYSAGFVGASIAHDIAVLRIHAPASKLRPLPIGESSDLRVGQATFAIGNPFGLDQTLTTGVVSALHRSITSAEGRTLEDMIQTDAAINAGNSGGPLLDSAGRVIGVNTAIFSPTGTNLGIGFAIPVDDVALVVPQLIEHGRIILPWIGARLAATRELEARYSVRFPVEGVYLLEVIPGSPADEAGLMPHRYESGHPIFGDIITAIDGAPLTTKEQFTRILALHRPGDVITLTLYRGGELFDVQLELDPAPQP